MFVSITKANARINELAASEVSLKADNAALVKKLGEFEAKAKEAVEQSAASVSGVEDIKAKNAAAIEALNGEHAKAVEALNTENAKAIDTLKADNAKVVDGLKAEHAKAVKDAQDALEAQKQETEKAKTSANRQAAAIVASAGIAESEVKAVTQSPPTLEELTSKLEELQSQDPVAAGQFYQENRNRFLGK